MFVGSNLESLSQSYPPIFHRVNLLLPWHSTAGVRMNPNGMGYYPCDKSILPGGKSESVLAFIDI